MNGGILCGRPRAGRGCSAIYGMEIYLDVTIQKLFMPLKNFIIHFLRIKNLFPAKGFLR